MYRPRTICGLYSTNVQSMDKRTQTHGVWISYYSEHVKTKSKSGYFLAVALDHSKLRHVTLSRYPY